MRSVKTGWRNKVAIRWALLLVVMMVSGAAAQEPLQARERWRFVSDEDGITIHTQKQSDGHVSIRARMLTPTNYGGFVALMLDIDNVADWAVNVENATLIKEISPNEHLVYTQFSAPWPVRDRDMVTLSTFYRDHEGFHMVIQTTDTPLKPVEDGYIRIPKVRAKWLLQKLDNGVTHVEYHVHADPGGLLPQWITNQVAIDDARETFFRLREQLRRYRDVLHPAVEE